MSTNSDRHLHPETRTVRALEADDWVADKAVVKQGKFSSDYLGIIDVIGLRESCGISPEVILVQATDNTHFANRVKKVLASPQTRKALKTGAHVEIWAWYRDRDEPKIRVIEWDDLHDSPPTPDS